MTALLRAEPPPSTVGAPTKLHAARTLAEHQTQAIIRQCNAAIRWATRHDDISQPVLATHVAARIRAHNGFGMFLKTFAWALYLYSAFGPLAGPWYLRADAGVPTSACETCFGTGAALS